MLASFAAAIKTAPHMYLFHSSVDEQPRPFLRIEPQLLEEWYKRRMNRSNSMLSSPETMDTFYQTQKKYTKQTTIDLERVFILLPMLEMIVPFSPLSHFVWTLPDMQHSFILDPLSEEKSVKFPAVAAMDRSSDQARQTRL
jgi:hypothetical protein